MKKYTAYNYRKIINLVFLIMVLILTLATTIVKNNEYNGNMLWEMMLSSELESNVKTGAIVMVAIILIVALISLLTIPRVLKKRGNAYFGIQCFITIALVMMLLLNKAMKTFSTLSIALIVIALIFNILATVFNVFIVKYNYDELYIDQPEEETTEEAKEDENN